MSNQFHQIEKLLDQVADGISSVGTGQVVIDKLRRVATLIGDGAIDEALEVMTKTGAHSTDKPTTSYEWVVSGKTWPHDGATVEVTFPAGHRPGDITRKATYDKETHSFTLEVTPHFKGTMFDRLVPVEAKWFTSWRYLDESAFKEFVDAALNAVGADWKVPVHMLTGHPTPKPTELTEREKWLMVHAFEAACGAPGYDSLIDWLEDAADTRVTVEMVLIKDAPQ